MTANTDNELLAMAARHDALWGRCGGATEAIDGAALDALCTLERHLVATPAFSQAGLAAKRRVVERAAFDDGDGIIAAILALDAERVGAER
ncbi:hypothetical protein [Bradyrhizobium sp. HKCCYLS3013]|uniref:hypothetical protein n=1 Tax=Bradyrhizobium sp. HKCCYLS3013 TaxID=3420735 RepID=UPI003EBA07A8